MSCPALRFTTSLLLLKELLVLHKVASALGSEVNLFANERTFPSQFPLDLLMFLWASLLMIAPVCGQSAIPKPVISLTPSWTTHFEGEKVFLKCNGFDSCVTGETQWYFNKKLLEETVSCIVVEKSGQYQCQTQNSPLSNPVSLYFLKDELILQTSYPVFEGDLLILRCLEKKGTELTQVMFYKNGKDLATFKKHSDFSIPKATLRNSGQYHCSAKKSSFWSLLSGKLKTQTVTIQIQELFAIPVLRSTTLQPTEGTPVTLSCETHLPPEKADTQLYFSFFRNGRIISSDQERVPQLQLIKVWKEDSGSYFCEAKTVTSSVLKRSAPNRIEVRRIPVSGIHLEIQPPGGQVTEGQRLVLLCSVTGGTGDIIFSWHKEDTGRLLKKKTQRLLMAKFEILAVKKSEAGNYYCAADNTNSPVRSTPVSISVRTSPLLLTFSVPETQMFVGKVVELRCDAQRASGPILYRFYHEGKIVKNSSAPFGSAAAFNLSLTEQHAGNYFCEADDGVEVQFSTVLMLSVKVPVSRPLLTIKKAIEGDVVELRCEAETGTTPILYRFFHQGIILGSSWTQLGEAAFLNLSLTAEDSGIYTCEADNGIGPQLSEGVKLSVTVPSRKERGLIAGGVSLGLLGFLGLIGVTLLLYFRTQRRSGESFFVGPCRNPAISRSQEDTQTELEPTYVNDPGQQSRTHNPVFADPGLTVNPDIGDMAYSELWRSQKKREDADDLISVLASTQDFSVVYSQVKVQQPLEDRVRMTEATDGTQKDHMGDYENVQLHS